MCGASNPCSAPEQQMVWPDPAETVPASTAFIPPTAREPDHADPVRAYVRQTAQTVRRVERILRLHKRRYRRAIHAVLSAGVTAYPPGGWDRRPTPHNPTPRTGP